MGAAAGALAGSVPAQGVRRPNILWITCEDTSPDRLGCYGSAHASTPALDQLAREGVRYTRAFSTAGVCAPTRSAIITGVHASTLGSQHMRSTIQLPPPIRCFSEYLREAGYYCTNNVKTDYNFEAPAGAWDENSTQAHWKKRKAGQPFFAVFNFMQTHEFQVRARGQAYAKLTAKLRPEQRQKREKIAPPPYYPDTAPVREEIAHTFELMSAVDHEAAALLREVDEAGLREDTLVCFFGDHGNGLPRAKRWLYDSGAQVPLLMRYPAWLRGAKPAGTVDGQLVSFLDLAPTMLEAAGVRAPDYMQGRSLLARGLASGQAREYVHAAHDRQDERYEMARMVRDKRFKYLRNYQAQKPYYQYMNSAEGCATMQEIRRVGMELPGVRQFLAERKPVEELYDTAADPHEMRNLAGEARMQKTLRRMRRECVRWQEATRDLGLIPEPELYAREKELGSRMRILEGPAGLALQRALRATLEAGEAGDVAYLEKAAKHDDAAVRYQALVGLGAKIKDATLEAGLRDASASVRVAAAEAGLAAGRREMAWPVMRAAMESDDEWVRLLAANHFSLRPELSAGLPGLEEAWRTMKTDRRNKTTYVPRVANRALNLLLRREDVVP